MPFLASRLSDRIAHAFGSEVLVFIIKDEPPGGYRSHYPRLAGKADHRFERKVLGDDLFLIGARRAVLKTFENRYATCGTTGIAAASVRQANSRTQSRLKNCFAWRSLRVARVRKAGDRYHQTKSRPLCALADTASGLNSTNRRSSSPDAIARHTNHPFSLLPS